MSSISAASYSDLDARTEFVLNRIAFLKSVPNVMQYENTPENKQKVAVWRDNNYITLIVRCIMDPNEEVYDHAIWATGNLLASDDKQVVTMTRAAITDDVLKHLVQMADNDNFTYLNPTVRNGIIYLFNNLSHYVMPRFFTEVVGCSLLKTMLTDKQFVWNQKTQSHFLNTVNNIATKDPSAINELLLIDALSNPDHSHNHSRLFRIVAALAEQDSVVSPLGIDRLMAYFTKQIATAAVDNKTLIDILWVLSNIMTELASPALFAGNHGELKSLVESIVWNEIVTRNVNRDVNVGFEALFVLVNYLNGVAKYMDEEFKKNVAKDDYLFALIEACMTHNDPKVVAVAREGFDILSRFRPAAEADEAVAEVDETDEVDEATEVDEAEEATEAVESDTENETDAKHVKRVVCAERAVPSASDLVLGANRGNESAAVRRVVSLLVDLPVGEWAEVPSDWTLSIYDLTTLQHLGYIIKDGYVGINPEIYSGEY